MKKLFLFSQFMWLMGAHAWGQACTNPITTYPYFQNFETNNGNWTSGVVSGSAASSWTWGTPAKAVIIGAASGTKAWTTNLTGNYNSNENSALTSPCFNFSTLVQPIFCLLYTSDAADERSSVD